MNAPFQNLFRNPNEGNTFFLMKLDFMHENGWGTAKNFTIAMDYYKQAALIGHAEGYMSLAKLYAYGKTPLIQITYM